jgi:activator of HSP90 ATPase
MRAEADRDSIVQRPARRAILTGAAVTIGGFVASAVVWGEPGRQMKEASGSPANAKRTLLCQEVELTASPERVYEILLNSKQFAAFSGAPAEIHAEAGGAFTLFGNLIKGRNVELVPNQRIVQAWRPESWSPGVYSLVRFALKTQGSRTHLVLDHWGFAEGLYDHLSSGWKEHYWEPMKKFLG